MILRNYEHGEKIKQIIIIMKVRKDDNTYSTPIPPVGSPVLIQRKENTARSQKQILPNNKINRLITDSEKL